MMNKSFAHGTFNGTGAALYICCGFVPDWVEIRNLEDSDCARIFWTIDMMRAAEQTRGYHNVGSGGAVQEDARTVSDGGIVLYYGGDVLSSASTTYLVPVPDSEKNQKKNSSTGNVVSTWTLDTSANRTGHFDKGVNTSYVGEGSLVLIDGKWYAIHSITNDGDAADEITLNEAAPSGEVQFIGPMYDYVGAPAGTVTPAGFKLEMTSVVNVSGELCCFTAGTFN